MSESEEAWNNSIISSRNTRGHTCYYADEERARQYNESILIWEDAQTRVDQLSVEPAWSVLEIGPGPGVMTIPLATRVKGLTVVEPAAPMVSLLQENLARANLTNVTIIQKTWETITPDEAGVHDLVLASYSLDMTNIGDCLRKMCRCARREVHLWWFLNPTFWEKTRQILNQGEKTESPKADILMTILTEMGYIPRLEILRDTSFPTRYPTFDEACAKMKGILNLSHTESLSPHCIEYIKANWSRPDGTFGYDDTTTYVHITVPMGVGE